MTFDYKDQYVTCNPLISLGKAEVTPGPEVCISEI